MDLHRFVYWISDINPRLTNLNGYLFLDRLEMGDAALLSEAMNRYGSLEAAQRWMNIVLLDSFISEAVGDDWDIGDPLVDAFLAILENSWGNQILAKYPGTRYHIDRLKDLESGDVGLRLIATVPWERANA